VSGTAGHYRRFLPSTLNASSFQLKFRAKAMADVMIAFMPNAVTSAEKAIEVALCADQNSKALVRYGTKSSTQHALLAETQGVFCDPYEMRPFWVR
jgi:hypothetical protein